MGLRSQLLLVSISILLLPWAGCQYVQEMEQVLRENQTQATAEKSALIAELIEQQLATQPEITPFKPNGSAFYSALRYQPVQVDGYDDDWQNHFSRPVNTTNTPFNAHIQKGLYRNRLYLFLKVNTQAIGYHNPGKPFQYSDHVRIITQSPDSKKKIQWLFFTSAPGQLQVMQWQSDQKQIRPTNNIEAWWQETPNGYHLELSIPASAILNTFDIEVHRAKKPSEPKAVISSQYNGQPSVWIKPIEAFTHLLAQQRYADQDAALVTPDGWPISPQRNWLHDSIDFAPQPDTGSMLSQAVQRFYRLLVDTLTPSSSQQSWPLQSADLGSFQTRFTIENLPLKNHQLGQWYQISTRNQSALLTVEPIYLNGELYGYLLLSKTADALISLTNQALQRVSHLTFITMLIVVAVLVLYASTLSWRIRSLKRNVELSISGEGKVSGFQPSHRGDEIGDLSRSFYQLLNRIEGYTDYLETLNGKLAHELRTPLAIVKSSLELVESQPGSETYLTRAEEGTERLRVILSAMSEASRVEQTIQQTDMQAFDLTVLLQNLQQAYQDAFGKNGELEFQFKSTTQQARVEGSPELLAQAMDKLIDNARSFADAGSNIELALEQDQQHYLIHVRNQGPTLPDNMENQIFDSLVSNRPQGSEAPHLGLGLFIVRLISEAHGGRASAKNLPQNNGVQFTIRLPALLQ